MLAKCSNRCLRRQKGGRKEGRDVAKRKAIKSNNPQDWAMDKRLRNRINGEVKYTKASYYASAFIQCNGDSRKTWQLINELTPRQKNNASLKELKLNENSVNNSHELSNAFNDHFSTNWNQTS